MTVTTDEGLDRALRRVEDRREDVGGHAGDQRNLMPYGTGGVENSNGRRRGGQIVSRAARHAAGVRLLVLVLVGMRVGDERTCAQESENGEDLQEFDPKLFHQHD